MNGTQLAISSNSVATSAVVSGVDLHHHHRNQACNIRELTICCAAANNKRKDRRDSGGGGHERKLIRSNSEDKIWESTKKIAEDKNTIKDSRKTIRRVSSHEDFNSAKHHHILSKLQKDMGRGLLHGSLPLQERTNMSPVSSKTSMVHHSSDVVLASEKFDCDAERLRNSERFSRSITPRGRRHARRRKLHINTNYDDGSSKENDFNSSDISGSKGQSFLEMLSGGASRSPSPVRPTPLEHDEANNPTPSSSWSFPIRQSSVEGLDERVEAMISPRNSIVTPRRFYSEDEVEDRETRSGLKEYGLKTLMKQINSLKKKIRKYEGEFEENFGYRPSHSDKMSNRDIKRIVSELNRVRKEHKILKEGFVGTLLSVPKFCREENSLTANNNNIEDDKARTASIAEMVGEIEKNLAEKRYNYNRPENLEDLTYEQLLDEKTAVQKALLSIENTFGRLVSKEDRAIVRPLSDRYRLLKRLLIRSGANRYQDSMSELATILEHETMDFSSTIGTPIDCDRRASEPDMSHRGILDCIESMEQVQTDSDSQPSSSESSRGIVESLHSLPKDELLLQQRITKEEKRRLRRALKEFEIQFEARAGRRMKREDRGPQVGMVYDSYKQTKAKLRLISALLAKNS
ncbi:hypothetical protein QAD02_004887 [Eretmocerus hayati]|uniref:Uncharacterized protein n=1 Tax=Eretmocerus hayati TaxID=131215 RepID=A0ACC2NQZ8_9HYME|nr:hypothetical protein QAD02_004887 [Eretmocerus hayati]